MRAEAWFCVKSWLLNRDKANNIVFTLRDDSSLERSCQIPWNHTGPKTPVGPTCWIYLIMSWPITFLYGGILHWLRGYLECREQYESSLSLTLGMNVGKHLACFWVYFWELAFFKEEWVFIYVSWGDTSIQCEEQNEAYSYFLKSQGRLSFISLKWFNKLPQKCHILACVSTTVFWQQ